MPLYLLIITSLTFNGLVYGSANEEADLQLSPFTRLPAELICYVADFLEGENKQGRNNFAEFAMTCRDIYQSIVSNSSLLAPTEEKELINILKEKTYEDLPTLAYKWSRNKKQFLINNLECMSEAYTNHGFKLPMNSDDYLEKMFNFNMALKFIILEFFLSKISNMKYIDAKLISFKEKKLLQYCRSTNAINTVFEAVHLKKVQGAIVSQKILFLIKAGKLEKNYPDIRNEILGQEKKFEFVNNFFSSIQSNFEDEVFKHMK